MNILFVALFLALLVACESAPPEEKVTRHRRAAVSKQSKPWPNGIIPYTFQFWNSTSKENDIARIEAGMTTWSQVTCVQFRLHNVSLSNDLHVRILNEGYCGSRVGCQPDLHPYPVQNLYLARDQHCLWRGLILHELGHLIGLLHEHQRVDRDQYVGVDTTNMNDEEKINFQIYSASDSLGTPYDPRSIMHYGSYIFSNHPRRPTLQLHYANATYHAGEISWKDLSFQDVKVVNKYYGCDSNCSETLAPCLGDAFRDKSCRCVTEHKFNDERCKDTWRHCAAFVVMNKCVEDVDSMYIHCRRSCNWCHTFPRRQMHDSPLEKGVCSDKGQIIACANWAMRGECHDSRRWMYKNCAKSCGRCEYYDTLNKLNPNSTCTDKWHFVDCDAWASTGECFNNPVWMRKNCRRSCNLCSDFKKINFTMETASNGNNQTQCDDKRITCQYWASMGLCQRLVTLMRKYCARVCGFCGKPKLVESKILPTTTKTNTSLQIDQIRCFNILPAKICEQYSQNGSCSNESIRQACSRTCRPQCFNTCRNRYHIDDLCDKWAQDGVCSSNRWVRNYCSQSCRTCPAPTKPCRDLRSSCPRRCFSLKDYRECRKSCGLCNIQCMDVQNHCAELRESRWCTLFSLSTSRACLFTCGLCTLQL